MDEIRVKADEIVSRLRNDPGFRRSVESDPEGVLRAAGLPEDLVVDFARGMADVQAHDICKWTCFNKSSECTKSYLV